MANSARALAAVALLVVCSLQLAAALNVNGGRNCKYVDPTTVSTTLRAAGGNTTYVNYVINRLKTVDNWVCKDCKGKLGMNQVFLGAVLEGYGECWCASGYGSSSFVKPNGRTVNYMGCTKCPSSKPYSYPVTGPYNPSTHKWTLTPCVNTTQA